MKVERLAALFEENRLLRKEQEQFRKEAEEAKDKWTERLGLSQTKLMAMFMSKAICRAYAEKNTKFLSECKLVKGGRGDWKTLTITYGDFHLIESQYILLNIFTDFDSKAKIYFNFRHPNKFREQPTHTMMDTMFVAKKNKYEWSHSDWNLNPYLPHKVDHKHFLKWMGGGK